MGEHTQIAWPAFLGGYTLGTSLEDLLQTGNACIGGPAFILRTSVHCPAAASMGGTGCPSIYYGQTNKHGFGLHDRGSSLTLKVTYGGSKCRSMTAGLPMGCLCLGCLCLVLT